MNKWITIKSGKRIKVQKKSEWVSVKDRLPKYKSIYIICADMGFINASIMLHEMVYVALWDGTNWIGVDDRLPLKYSIVTHWMPLPEPPKESDAECTQP